MKAVVFHGIGDIRLETVRDPKLKEPTDALIRITASAICGTDLHFVRGTLSGLEPGATLGHEAVGVIEEVGKDVRNFKVGRPRGGALDHLLRLLLLLPRRLPVAMRRRAPEGAARRHAVLRRRRAGRRLRRAAGRVRAHRRTRRRTW